MILLTRDIKVHILLMYWGFLLHFVVFRSHNLMARTPLNIFQTIAHKNLTRFILSTLCRLIALFLGTIVYGQLLHNYAMIVMLLYHILFLILTRRFVISKGKILDDLLVLFQSYFWLLFDHNFHILFGLILWQHICVQAVARMIDLKLYTYL